jgi:hypothetical protein
VSSGDRSEPADVARHVARGEFRPGGFRVGTVKVVNDARTLDDAAFRIDVVRMANGKVAEFTTFGPELFARFGLPPVLP